MPAGRASLPSFLAAARAAVGGPAGASSAPALTFVVGNESADVDSLCSALVCAYLRSHMPPRRLHVPLANLPPGDLTLRPEMTAVLGRVGLGPADLLTLDDLPEPEQLRHAAPDANWLLVDHNVPTAALKRFLAPSASPTTSPIVGCVDHHEDEGFVPHCAQPRIIQPCGSCMSLVVEYCCADWDALSRKDATADAELALLALPAILLDTVNLTSKHKVRAPDIAAARYLISKIDDSRFDPEAYFHTLCGIKNDLSSFSLRDILRKDYKQWDEAGITLGISMAVQDLSFLVHHAGNTASLLEHLVAWATERHLDVLVVMTASTTHRIFRRHLFVWGHSERGKAAARSFANAPRAQLRLEPWLDAGALHDLGEARFAWVQGDLASSRKQVSPLLRETLKSA